MVGISSVNNPYLKTSAANPVTPTDTTKPVATTSLASPTISTKNSSSVAISPPAVVKLAASAATAASPMTVAAVLAANANITANTVIKDSAANIQARLKDLSNLPAIANVTSITLTDTKGTITVAGADIVAGSTNATSAAAIGTLLKKITSSFTLNVTALGVTDALALKSPASTASLTFAINDTMEAVSNNLAALQTAAKAKTLTAINITAPASGSPKPALVLSAAQLKANPEVLATLKGDYDLTITGVAAADSIAVAGSADKVLSTSASKSTQSKIAISDTSANLVKGIATLETAATAGRLSSITVSDGKALSLTEAQIKADSHVLATQFTTSTTIEATAVKAADVAAVQALFNANNKSFTQMISIADTAANIQANLDSLEAAVKPSQASAGANTVSIAAIAVTDKGVITTTNATLVADLDALKVLTGAYKLIVTEIGVTDALALKAPSKDATLALSVKDTADKVSANWDALQAAAKSLTSLSVTDGSSSLLKMTAAQLKSDAAALALVTGDYKLGVTGVVAADVTKTLATKNIYSVEVKDTAANILINLKSIQTAVTAAKIQSVTITDAANPALAISDIFALTTSLPNLTLATGVKFNVKDTASNIIAHARDDIGDVLKNAGTVTFSDKTAPNLTLADATTLQTITNLDRTAKYNVTDSGTAIAAQAAIAGEKILSGAASVSINKNFTVKEAIAVTGIKSLAKGTVYSITDNVDNVLAQSAAAGDKIVTGANTVTVVDTSTNIIAKLDQLEGLAKLGKIADIKFTDTPSNALNITQDQLVKDAEAIGKIISQRILPTLTLTKPATPAPLAGPTPGPTTVPSPSMNGTTIPSLTNNNKPTFAGTAAGNSTITLYNNSSSTAWATVQSDASGNWSYTPTTALADGNYSITAKTTNASGLQSAASAAIIFKIDTAPPSAPTLTGPTGTTNINKPTLSGLAEANSIVKLYDGSNATPFATVTAGVNGQWTFTPTTALADGSYTVMAKATDPAGNTSVASTALTFTVSTVVTAPASMTWDGTQANGFEQIASMTSKTLSTPQSTVSETINLVAGASYTFGVASLSSTSGAAKLLQILDKNNNVVASTTDISKSYDFTATVSGTYTVKLTVSNAQNNASIGSYQLKAYQYMSKLPELSGDANVDALLNGLTPYWLHPAGAVATNSTDLIHAGLYSLSSASSKHQITYSFLTSLPANDTEDATGFRAMNNTEKQAVQAALSYIATVINVTFTLATTPGQADINFGTNNQGTVSSGYANMPNSSGDHPEYLFLNNAPASANFPLSNADLSVGSYGWQTLIHEVGHTLGLKHPGDYNAGGGGGTPPYLPPETDITRFSVMSYNEPKNVTVNSGGYLVPVNPQTFMVYDLEALQYLYGANKTTAANQMVSFADNFVGMKTIWSPNGATINLTSSTKSNLIDLRQGAYSSINMITPPNQTTYDGKNNVGIAYGSIVDSVIGGSGDDIIYANADGDIIDGGAGANTVYLPGSQSDWTITTGANGVKQATHKATNKVTTLTNIQTITYYVPDNTALTHA